MYHPYLRGKRHELASIRKLAALLSRSNFVPIIEPVNGEIKDLRNTLKSVCESRGKAIVIINPHYGEHRTNGSKILELLHDGFLDGGYILPGFMLKEDTRSSQAIDFFERHRSYNPAFIHSGFLEPDDLAERMNFDTLLVKNIYFDHSCQEIYRKKFPSSNAVSIRDGFIRLNNADYPPCRLFSDLHLTFKSNGLDGFGDFLIVGRDFREAGGPAYAVTIHLTYIDPDKNNAMYSRHFVSDSNTTSADPAGKFAEALNKLISYLSSGKSQFIETSAISELRDLHARGHYPGLGPLKELSMNHHIETLAHYMEGI